MSKTNNTIKKRPKRPTNIANSSTKTINVTRDSPSTKVCNKIIEPANSFKLGFWDKNCSKFTKKLWKPPLDQKLYTPNWGNDNKLLTFERSHDIKNATKLNFLPSPELDNMPKKRVLFNKKFGAEISRFAKFIENKELQEFVHKYIKDLNEGLVRIRKRKNKNNTLDAFKFSNSSFKRFCSKYSKTDDISDAEKKIIDPHINVFNNIHKSMDALDRIIRCKTVKILPTKKQKKILDKWFQSSTEIYNDLITKFQVVYDKCLQKCNELYPESPKLPHFLGKMLKASKRFPSSGRKLRDLVINEYKKFDLPNSVLADIIINFASNIKGNVTKLLSCQITEFTIAPRDAQKNYSLSIQKKNTNATGFYPTMFGEIATDDRIRKITKDAQGRKKKQSNFKWNEIKKDYKLMYDTRYKGYVIFCPMEREYKDVQIKRKPIAIMDPGEVKFQELYGIDHSISIGKGLRKPILKHFRRIEYMKKRLSNKEFNIQERAKFIERQKKKEEKEQTGKTKNMLTQEKSRFLKKQKKKKIEEIRAQKYKKEQDEHRKIIYDREVPKRNNLKRVIKREYAKISNLVTELHNKTCLYLCRNYDKVMVTNFSCKKVNSKFGVLPKVIKKVLGALSHYKFRQRLQNKCAEYRCQYLEVTEEYTSKTCCMCGSVNMEINDDRTLFCKTCEVIDRDVNGSINIFIKNRHEVLEI